MNCPSCGAENTEDRRFCTECGASLLAACTACGFQNPSSAKFCGGCGTALAGTTVEPLSRPVGATAAPALDGELRQVTVLFADLSGFTELSRQLDAEELHALLNRYFEAVDGIVQDYGGSVDKHIGDCVMAVFGAPVAHSNDPERAIRAALGIHAAMREISRSAGRPFQAHIGIAGGQVVASGTGSARHQAYTVTGESVNLAARLTDLAGPGETLLSDPVRRAALDLAESEPAGDIVVKGFSQPVRIWRLRGLRSGGLDRARPFVGRSAELQQFLGALDACRETGSGRAIHVRGEAGIGKTRLVDEFRRHATQRGFACHTGLVLDFGVAMGQDAVRAIVRGLLGIATGDAAAAQRAAEQAIADGLLEPDRQIYLNDLLDLPQPTELRAIYDAMDSPVRTRGKRETVAELARRVSQRRPLMLIVEDLHWADAATLAHLAALAATVADCPAMLVMTSRIEDDPLDQAWRAAARGCPLITFDLGPLRRPEALALAGTFIDATGRFVMACIERAEGNPLFLEQLLRNAGEIGAEEIPGSVQSLVLARMDRLAPLDRQALQAAAAIGQRFSLAALRHVMESPGYDCAALLEHYLVRPEGEDFLFSHALIQEGVYGSLLKARKRELHRRAAEWFAPRDPILHAEHLDRAEAPGAPQAYLKAAQAQAEAYRTERALELADRGLEIARERSDRFALTCLRGELLHDLGAMAQSIEIYEQALALAGDDAERCRSWLGLAAGFRVTDRHEQAIGILEQAEAAAVRHGLMHELARIHHLRGNLYFMLGNLEGCRERHVLALDHARRAGSVELEARALGGLADAVYAEGRMLSAYDYFHRCCELARQHGFGRIEVANLPMAAITRLYSNDVRGALDEALGAIEAAARVGHRRAEIIARHAAFSALFAMGEFASAREHIQRAQAYARQLGSRRFEAEDLYFLAQLHRVEGDRRDAMKLLREALAISRATGMDFIGPTILGGIAAATDDPAERRSALEEGESLLRRGSLSHNHLFFHQNAIEAALASRDWADVDHFATALRDYTAREPLPWSDLIIARAQALADFGRGNRGAETREVLRRLRDEAERIGVRIALPALDRALAAAE